jgi:hypothetical protein
MPCCKGLTAVAQHGPQAGPRGTLLAGTQRLRWHALQQTGAQHSLPAVTQLPLAGGSIHPTNSKHLVVQRPPSARRPPCTLFTSFATNCRPHALGHDHRRSCKGGFVANAGACHTSKHTCSVSVQCHSLAHRTDQPNFTMQTAGSPPTRGVAPCMLLLLPPGNHHRQRPSRWWNRTDMLSNRSTETQKRHHSPPRPSQKKLSVVLTTPKTRHIMLLLQPTLAHTHTHPCTRVAAAPLAACRLVHIHNPPAVMRPPYGVRTHGCLLAAQGSCS